MKHVNHALVIPPGSNKVGWTDGRIYCSCRRENQCQAQQRFHGPNETQDQLPRPRAGVAAKLKGVATLSGETSRGAVSCIAWLGLGVAALWREKKRTCFCC